MTNTVNLATSINVQSSSGVTAINSSYQGTEIATSYTSTSHTCDDVTDQDIMTLEKAYYVYIRVVSGSFVVNVSWSDGITLVEDQVIPVDSLLVLKSRVKYVTDLKVTGTGELEVVLAGE